MTVCRFLRGALALATLLATPHAPLSAQRAEPAFVARGAVHGGIFHSRALGVTKRFMVWLPPSYATAPQRRYPVVYLLHGLGGRETDWLAVGGVDAVADSLVAAGMPEAVLVLPDGDDSWYSEWRDPQPYAACRDSLMRESPERGCVRAGGYDRYIAEDLVAHVDSTYRTRAGRAHRAIAGLSMGGYGALKLALAFPRTFGAAASHSGAVSRLLIGPAPYANPPRYAMTVDTLLRGYMAITGARMYGRDLATWQANDPATLARRLAAAGGAMPALYMDCGTSDALIGENRALAYELTQAGIPHEYREHPGAHTWRYWNTHVRESLPWLLARIGQ